MRSNQRKLKLQDAFEYASDRTLRSIYQPSRIFIEPPEETHEQNGDSDDDLPRTMNVNCEIILRNGKRAGKHLLSPKDEDCVDSPLKEVFQPPAKRTRKVGDEVSMSLNNRKRKFPHPKSNNDVADEPSSLNRKREHFQPKSNIVTKRKCDINLETICDDEPVEENKTQKKAANKKTGNEYVWIDDDSKPMEAIFPMPNYTDCNGYSAYEQFEKFFDNELLELIIKEASSYAAHLGKADPKITIAELRVYIAILMISGYSVQSRLESYWSKDPDLRNQMIYSSMRKNRFKQITQFLHFEDMNKPNSSDKIWKLRPLTDYLKKKFLMHFHAEQNLSYDGSMIEYYGRHGMKQCLKEKPIPFGYKVWCLCTVSGYLVNFEIYQGKNPRSTSIYEENYGKCIAPLFNMIDDFEDHIRQLPFSFYFDNLFTGIPALLQLKTLGFNATGTIRENRLPNSCPIKQKKKETKKLGRGFMTGKSVEGLNLHVTKWVDNAVVSVASTVYGMNPVTKALRYSSEKQSKIEVPRPFVVAKYNQFMGGVDRMDQNVSLYRIGIHGKKWWSTIFTWMIDVAIENAWQLHRVANPEMRQLDFRREITLYYCRHYGVPPKSTGNRSSKKSENDLKCARFDNINHWPRSIPKRGRCAGETCDAAPKTICAKCDVGLCIKCFESYHCIEKFKE